MLDIELYRDRLRRRIWETDPPERSALAAWGFAILRGAYALGRELSQGQLTLQAMSLVYTTLLSLVPLLALTFSVLKAFGVRNQIEPLLATLLEPLGEKGAELTARIIEFVENIQVGLLGALGLGLLIYTVSSLIQKVESAFNYTWHVRRTRPFAQRFSQYLSVLTIGPVLVFSALGITATFAGTSFARELIALEPVGTLVAFIGKLVPYVLVIGAFTFLYVFIPNTKVHFKSALFGGVIAGALWQSIGWIFATSVVASTKYTAIYSSFAVLFLFMIWLYISWLILLTGATVAFFHQHPEHLRVRRGELRLNNRAQEQLALLVGATIARRFHAGDPPCTLEYLAQQVKLPVHLVEPVLVALKEKGILLETAEEPPTFPPAKPLEQVRVKDLLDAVREATGQGEANAARLPRDPAVNAIVERVDQALDLALRSRSLRELAQSGAEEPASKTGNIAEST